MMKKTLLLLFVIVLFCACVGHEEGETSRRTLSVTANKEFVISEGVYLKIREVVDMRKPSPTMSKWNGEAKLRVQLYTGKRSVDTAISTNFPNEIVLDGIRLKLNSVYPYPELNKVRRQSDYVAQISYSKGE